LSEPAGITAESAEVESDHLHAQVGWVLRIGLALSVVLLVAGMALRVVSGVEDAPSVPLWQLGGDPSLVLSTLGVLVLALTPALRVVALIVLWWRERDWRFVGVALAVAATLCAGVLLGKGG
jgi:uncharacterized membrane protein